MVGPGGSEPNVPWPGVLMISSKPTKPVYARESAFPAEATEVLRRLRRAIAEMFDNVPGGIRKSRDVQKLFGVSTKLSWQIFKLTGPGDALSLAPHVPKGAAMSRVLEGAEKYGVAPRLINEVRAAYSAFEELIETHAGDRTSFESMARGLSGSHDARQNDLQHRKAIFRGHSHFWGAQVETRVLTRILHPGSMPGRFDYLTIRSMFGLRRLRGDAEVVIDTIKMTPPRGTHEEIRSDLLEPEAAERFRAPILPHFCDQPLPQLRTRSGKDGTIYTELAEDVLGRRGAVNLVFGQVWRNTEPSPAEDGTNRLGWLSRSRIWIPTASLVVDMLVHRQSLPQMEWDFGVYGHTCEEDLSEAERVHPRLPFKEEINKIEAGIDGARIQGVPRYLEMLRYVTDRLNWHLDDFDVYRVQIEYPMIDTMLSARFNISGTGSPAASAKS